MKTLLALCLLAAGSLHAADRWVEQGNDAFYNLDFEESIADYEKALSASPDDPTLHNHLAHALLYRELFRNGALESELVSGNNSFIRRAKLEPPVDVEKRFFMEVERSMQLCQARIGKNAKDTLALHALSVAFALRANYGFLVRKSWRASLYDCTQAKKYDNQVSDLEPDNYDAKLLQGGFEYIAGSLSWTMRAVSFMAGFHGDKQRGLHTIEDVAAKGKENRVDAQIMLCALYRREGQPRRAIPLVQQLIQRYPHNYLLRFELAQMYAGVGARNEARATVSQITAMKRDNAAGYDRIPWEKIYFETGNMEFWFDDLDTALNDLKKVTSSPAALKDLDLNTGALALMRQGQIYDLEKRHDLAIPAYQQAVKFAPEAEAARESQHYINSPYQRPVRNGEHG